jgi:hypothetical protein
MNSVVVEQFTENTVETDITKTKHVSENTFYQEKLKTYTLFKASGVGKDYKITDGIYVSPLNNFTLDDFVIVRQLFCSGRHTNGCLECSRLLEFARLVKDGGIIEFAATYRTIYPHLVYKSDLAVRKMMQAPLCVFKMATMGHVSEKLYVTEKIASVDYSSFITLTKKVWQTQKPSTTLDKTALKELCNLASSEKDKLLIKYVCCKSQNLSMNKARQLYGFWNFNQQKEKINNALLEMREIHDVIEELAAIKDTAVLQGFGICVEDEHSSSESECSLSDAENSEIEWISEEEKDQTTPSRLPSDDQLLSMLRNTNFNWFAFITEVKMLLPNNSENTLLESLEEFSGRLSVLNVSAEDQLKIETSRQAYFALEKDKAIHESLSDEDETSSRDISEAVRKRRIMYRRKHVRQKAKRMAEARLLKRKLPKRVSRILKKFPNIGKDVEEFVSGKRVGADAWRRTGVLTFDGNIKQGPKVTYKGIQNHLQTKYGIKISYGTVVQLSVIRNKRRLSAKRYRGVARITCRRARKGFSIKMNPGAHWNTAMYRSLDYLQLKNGTEQLVLNRDDAAGFRLDTTFTHKQHKGVQLLDSHDLTSRTDYMNKYTSVLQTTSYLFPSTSSTPPTCIGVIKPHVIFEKNPSQHMADLNMLAKQEQNTAVFNRLSDGQRKDIWYVRVDGSSDEGPVHKEVQFLWTEKHVMDNHSCTVVTTRHSGGSYLNSVELMNGCLSVAHNNCFIPSTLGGPVEDENGINTEQLKRNLDLAADVYISRVNGAPCCGTTVQLCKGNRSDCAQKLLGRRQKLLTFLHGKAIEKLLKDEPDIFHYFRKVWDVFNNHMVPSIPKQYALMLLPCFKEGCIHPLCKTGKPAIEPHCTWFPNGPPLSYFPLPIPDVDRPWGGDCTSCSGFCAGHYKKPEDAWKSYQEKDKTICQIKPPSVTLLERFDESVKKGFDLLGDENRINELAKQVLLTSNEVKMWLKHLKAIKLRRKEGAKKAAATRAAKKGINFFLICIVYTIN